MKYTNPTKVITGPNTRFSYANVWEAKSINGGAPKFSVSLIIPKSDTRTVEKIKAAIEAAYKEGESKLRGTAAPFLRFPLSRIRCATATPSAPTMKPMQTAISSTLTLQPLPVSWTLTAIPFWSAARFTAAFTAERQSHFMHLTPTAIRESPAV